MKLLATRIALVVLVIIGLFVFWHSAGRAEALCLRERFVA